MIYAFKSTNAATTFSIPIPFAYTLFLPIFFHFIVLCLAVTNWVVIFLSLSTCHITDCNSNFPFRMSLNCLMISPVLSKFHFSLTSMLARLQTRPNTHLPALWILKTPITQSGHAILVLTISDNVLSFHS